MTEAFGGVFRGKRVLVTGHTGFKGSWLAIWLHGLGANVAGYALEPPTEPSNFVAAGVAGLLCGSVVADVRDRDALLRAFQLFDPEIIFHLAAQSLVREGYRDPMNTFSTNVIGTANVLDVARERKRPCAVIVVTSDKCYENHEQIWGFRECDRLGGHDPYSASKSAAEIITASYQHSYFGSSAMTEGGAILVASARAGNVIGGGDWGEHRIVPDFVRSISRGQPVLVRNPGSVRPWQHVLEPLSGYLELASRLLSPSGAGFCSAWNFGPEPGDCSTVADLVENLCAAWDGAKWIHTPSATNEVEASCLRLNIEKAIAGLGWRPRWTLAEAIGRTARWYRSYYSANHDARTLCSEDIKAFEQTHQR